MRPMSLPLPLLLSCLLCCVLAAACNSRENAAPGVTPSPKAGGPTTPAMPPTMLPPANPVQIPPNAGDPAAVQNAPGAQPVPAPPTAPGAVPAPGTTAQPAFGQPVPTTPTAAWKPPLTPDELKALDRYAGFSRDGLVLVAVQFSSGAGLPIASFISSTTNTVEKTVPLESGQAREKLAAELAEEGYPKPGTQQQIPKQLGAELRDGQVLVTFSGMPAGKLYRPFGSAAGMVPVKAELVAVSPDGKHVAVRATGKGAGEFGPPIEYRVVSLFE